MFKRYNLDEVDSIVAFFVAYCSGPLPSSRDGFTTKTCLIHEAKSTLEIGLYAGIISTMELNCIIMLIYERNYKRIEGKRECSD